METIFFKRISQWTGDFIDVIFCKICDCQLNLEIKEETKISFLNSFTHQTTSKSFKNIEYMHNLLIKRGL